MSRLQTFTAEGLVAFGSDPVEVCSFNGRMAILTEEMPILITEQQAIDFFGLIKPTHNEVCEKGHTINGRENVNFDGNCNCGAKIIRNKP